MESNSRPIFAGAAQLVELIGKLYQRPPFGDRPREPDRGGTGWHELPDRQERSGRRGLPMVCLVRPEGQDQLLSWVSEELHRAKPDRVPHAFIQLNEIRDDNPPGIDTDPLTDEDVEGVRTILSDVTNELTRHANGHAGRFRFRLFSLLNWLMDQEFSQDTVPRERALRKELRKEDISQRWDDTLKSVGDALPSDSGWLRWPFAALRMLPQLIFLVAVTGRVPVLSRRYRWFLRQRYLSPEVTGGFVSFAGRLTKGQWVLEDKEQVARLLISSFLEDIRRAYRWRPWQLWRARRMTYVTLLLDNITRANGGYTMLRLINEVRNDVGRFDPLLVISASHKVPPDAGATPGRPHYDAEHALEGYQRWQNSLFADRRKHGVTAWYLPLRVPGPPSEPERQEAEQRIGPFNGYRVRHTAAHALWLSGRILRVMVVIILLGGLAAGYDTWSHKHCGGWGRFPDLSLPQDTIGTECIGITDGSYDIFQPQDPSIKRTVQIIQNQNQSAENLHAAHGERPYITLVDMQALTSSTGSSDGLTTERESLEGFAVAQYRQLQKHGSTEPIVRVLIANAGQGMSQGVTVARKLRTLDTGDAPIVGVVGLDMSSQPTVQTISALSDAGLPMVAAALSADSLATDNHPMYFQVAPQNTREAAVVAAWANQYLDAHPSIPREVRVYYSGNAADTYSTNLRDDVMESFKGKGFQVKVKAFTSSPDLVASESQNGSDEFVGTARSAGSNTCSSYTGFVFFAGRGLPDYADFLNGAGQCGSKATFIGGDDVTRYVADPSERKEAQTPPFFYLSFAPAPVTNLQVTNLQDAEKNFYTTLNALFPFERDEQQGRSLDGHAALSYDAAEVLILATTHLRESSKEIPITPGAVWQEIATIPTSQTQQSDKHLEGVTGAIDFGGDMTRHVPQNKRVAILQVINGEVDPKIVAVCGPRTDPTTQGPRTDTTQAWCPYDQ
ncbi:MAG: hypothetical protein ACRDRW_20880 [Pseudonocardiaceae bacterium]